MLRCRKCDAMESKRGAFSENPFPGLRPFRDDEAYLFFGRESQVDAMVDKLAKRHFLAVVGTSGSGKSSLVNCGLRPGLHRGLMATAGIRWRMVQFRPGNNPLRAMAKALAEDDAVRSRFDFDLPSLQGLVEASLRMSTRGLSEVYKRAQLGEGTNLLVVVDQFEELFRYRDVDSPGTGNAGRRSQEATAFVNLLLDARAQTDYPIYIVATMRSDFLGDCAEFTGLPEAINDGQYLVPRLTRDERRAAIAGPVGVGGGTISPVLLTRLVNDVGDNPDQLSILQHAMNRTWARWKHEGMGEGELDLSDYEAIGTMSHALDQHAEKAYGELSGARQQTICEKIFKALTDKRTDPGVRRPMKCSALCELTGASVEEVTEVINIFRKTSRSFLMPPLPEALDADTIVDISHESLMRLWERLKRWTEEEVQSAQLYRRLSETAVWHAAGKAALWDDPDLQFALDWKNREQPTERWAQLYGGGFEQAMSFLAESEVRRNKQLQEKEEMQQRELQQAQDLAEERQRRIEQQASAAGKMRRRMAALAGAAVVLLFVTVYAVHEKRQAGRAEAATKALLAEKSVAYEKEVAAEQHAEWRRKAAVRANEEMRLEALRMRNVNLDSLSGYAALADSLLQYSDKQESARWLRVKADALLQLGDYQGAQPLLDRVLDTVPGDVNARTDRGYLLLLRDQPAAALKDFEYIRDRIDQRSALNYLNLTITQARLGRYPAASASLAKAMQNVSSMDVGSENGEVLIPPEINQATGRTTLQADKATFEAALYYMQVNLEAYTGEGEKGDFEKALARADERTEALSTVAQKDAYFIAMTWAWLNIRDRCSNPDVPCNDYGALFSEAVLWERAGYKMWAGCYYQKFQERYDRWHDPKYASLGLLADKRRKALGLPPTASCPKPPEPDALTLETEAKEAVARKKFQEAKVLYEKALGKAAEPDKVRLLMGKADALFQIAAGSYDEHRDREARVDYLELKNHCTQIIQKEKSESKPYLYRAVAQYFLDMLDSTSPSFDNRIQADVRRALIINPADADTLELLDNLTPDNSPGDDIKYLRDHSGDLARYYKMSPYSSRAFRHQAMLAEADKQYKKALGFIETAIGMEPEDTSLYDIRQRIEVSAGISPAEMKQDLIEGYLQAYFVMKRRGNPSDENRIIEINKKISAELAQNRPGE